MTIRVIRKPLAYYAGLIKKGNAFSFVRYGEGEIKWLVPELPTKPGYPSFESNYVRDELQLTLTDCHLDSNYLVAVKDLWHFREKGQLDLVEAWFAKNCPLRRFYGAAVFRDAAVQGAFYPMVRVIRRSPLPVIVVGPERIRPIMPALKADRFIATDPVWAYQELEQTQTAILKAVKSGPAIISFSVSFAAKVMIHRLYSLIGKACIMIDFGSLWDGLCGLSNRPYHPKLTPDVIKKNLRG